MKKQVKDILIAYLPGKRDLSIAISKHWYRIPEATKLVPRSVKKENLRIVAFYQPKIFGDDAFAVRYYGNVKNINRIKRKVLFKGEPSSDKSEAYYYKIEFDRVLRLPRPIYSRRHRRILFISTTLDRFEKAEEINDLFLESPLEERFWLEFKKYKIIAERQYLESIKKSNFYLDFAIFCRRSKLAIECDGDNYHTSKEMVQKDKQRDNLLESHG